MIFASVAALLTLMALGFILMPWLRLRSHADASEPERELITVALYRAQFDELDRCLARGELSSADYEDSRQDLERRMLDDAGETETLRRPQRRSGLWLMLLVLLLPLSSWSLYEFLGGWHEWRLMQRYQAVFAEASGGAPESDKLMELLGELTAYTRASDDPDWLYLQAQTQMQVGAYPAAVSAFARLREADPGNADIVGWQAQALYLANGRRLNDEAEALIDEALAINPHQSTVLGIRGISAFQRGDFNAAIGSWEQALAGLAPGTPSATMLEQGIREARAALDGGAAAPGRATNSVGVLANTEMASASQGGGGFADGIVVRVELDAEAQVNPGSTVFVIASAPGGGMPFAVVRLPVEGLPTEVTLDDSSAMAPGRMLSRQSEVKVTARVSASGNAIAQAGDWQGRSVVLTPETAPPVVPIRIDQEI